MAQPYWLTERRFTAAKRKQLAKKGLAMPDGSFPIETKGDLKNAIGLVGNADNPAAAKRHVIKRARALGAVSMLPETWGVKEVDVTKKKTTETSLPLSNRDFRTELGRALLADSAFARDMSMAAARALAGDPLKEAERSFDAIRDAVSQALRDKYEDADEHIWPWIRELFDDKVVFELDGDTFQATYSIDDDENVTLGDKVEVEVRYEPVITPKPQPTSEADPLHPDGLVPLIEAWTPLLEKAVRRDDTIALKVIEPGRGSTGFYTKDVLERDAAAAFPQGTKMYWDHPTESEMQERPERSLRDLAAELVSDAAFVEDGAQGPGVYADAKVFGPYKESVDELAEHIGTSIHALGVVDEDATADDGFPRVVERIAPSVHNSIDFVTQPGAGGKVMELFESARGRGRRPAPRKEEGHMDEREAKTLREAKEAADRRVTELTESLSSTEKERDEAKEAADRAREAIVVRQAQDFAQEAFEQLAESDGGSINLPVPTRKRLAERLSNDPPTTDDGELDKKAYAEKVKEAIKAEAEYLAEVTGSGRIRGLGESDDPDQPSEEDRKKLQESLESSFAAMGLDEKEAKAAAEGRS